MWFTHQTALLGGVLLSSLWLGLIGPGLALGQDPDGDLLSRMDLAIARAGEPLSPDEPGLLPSGTLLDSAAVDESKVGHVQLTFPDGIEPAPMPESRAQALDELLRGAFDQPLAGMRVEVRSSTGEYQSLGDLVLQPALLVDDPPQPVSIKSDSQEIFAEPMLAGPSANADGQPTGALSGVVVFCNAGHGWTAGSSNWVLQRPLLHSMNEDYGNIDQLNYFVNYLYNAGATVVPFRPVGYQSIEIVLDNDDPGVVFSGSWISDTTNTYYYENGATNSGVRLHRIAAGATQTATARYTPNISVPDFYPVYTWATDRSDGVPQTYRVCHSGGTAEVVVDHGRVGRGWIWLGNYYFEAGTGGYVEITNRASVSGTVVADAIRFGNGMGDIVRPGPGRVSGYPREEEAARYWAQSEAGINGKGLPSSIWDCCGTDGEDNVSAGTRWASHMNRIGGSTERWRRIFMEFHTNASSGAAKGTVALYNVTNGTTNQFDYATIVGEKVEADMFALHHLFEYPWGARNPNTYHADFAYGAISGTSTNNEFDATILEVAFHDNAQDAANLRNARVRDAVARSTVQSMIMFLSNSTRFPGTQVQEIFAPDPPEQVRARADAGGNVVVSWVPGPTRPSLPASGDAATGYKIYRSTNGYGFGNAVTVGNVLSATLSDLPADQTVYLRVAALNAGGESMPSPTMAVRRPATGTARVLIVDGFDRVSRQQNHIQYIPGAMERPIARIVNSFDYSVEHATALAAAAANFDYATNEAVSSGAVPLADYDGLVWILGEESAADKTFDSTEQALVTNYLNSGGNLFVSGSEIGYELDYLAAGRPFYENMLRADFVEDNAGVYVVRGAGGVFADIGNFDFSPANGAAYVVESPDHIAARVGAVPVLEYVTGAGKPAAVQYDSGFYRTITLGFPFEVISSPAVRAAIMQRAMDWLVPVGCPNRPDQVSGFEGYAVGSQVMFRNPRYSASTIGHLLTSPDSALVTDEVPGFDGSKSLKVSWQWVDTSPTRWLRLTTSQAPSLPNPIIDMRQVVQVRLRLDSGSLRVALGVRETGVDGPIGSNGGTAGPIEWIGASSQVPNGGPVGILVTAQPGVWQTVTFAANLAAVVPFTGNGILETANGKVVLEHLAFSVVDTAGPITLYIDAIEQPCRARMDLDGDGDVDQEDFGYLQACLSGTGVLPWDMSCWNVSLDADQDVDPNDVLLFQKCFAGPGLTVDPVCAD